jgi:hypothetical protein
VGKANNDSRADLPKYVEQDALSSLDVIGEHGAKGFIVNVLAP